MCLLVANLCLLLYQQWRQKHAPASMRNQSLAAPAVSPFDVLLCGTRNTVFGGTRHTTPTLLIHVLLSGTRGTVLGGTRHTTHTFCCPSFC